MKNKWLWGVLIFGIVATAIGAIIYFNYKTKTAKDFVPAASDKVLRINLSELQKIASIADFSKLTDMYSGSGFGVANNLVNEVLRAESSKEGSSGLDLKSDGFFFTLDAFAEDQNAIVKNGIVFSIKNKEDWEKFIKTNKLSLKETNELKIEKTTNCSVYHSSKAQTFAWNSNVMIFSDDVIDNSRLNSFFSSTEDKAIKFPQFQKFLDKTSHIGMYFKDMNSFSNKLAGAGNILSQQKTGGFAAYVNFENGKIKINGEMLGSADVLKQFDFFSTKPVSADMIAFLPEANPTGFFSFNLDMDKILDFVSKNEGMNTAMRLFLASKGLTINDVKQIFSGEIVFTINFINPTSDEFMGMSNLTPQMHVMIGSKNPEKLKGVLDDLGLIKFGNSAWQAGMGSSNINVVIKNKTIMITNNDANAKNFNEGFAGVALKNQTLKNGAMATPNYMYFNLKEYLLSNPMLGSGFISPAVTEQIEYVEMKGDYTKMDGAIFFKDKSQNSLKVIMNLLSEMKLRPAQNESEILEELSDDSAFAEQAEIATESIEN